MTDATANLSSDEKLLYGVTRLALARGHADLAVILLDCTVTTDRWDEHSILATLYSPIDAYDALLQYHRKAEAWDQTELERLFESANNSGLSLDHVWVKPSLDDATPDWRNQLRGQIEGKASNQGRPFGDSRIIVHNGLNYRSQSEVEIAKQLERSDEILFFPNAGAIAGKVPKEPDFLVFYRNKVGVLEVDGPTHSGRAADDSIRDSYFQRQGLFIKHYPSEQCLNEPEQVVKEFLRLLLKS